MSDRKELNIPFEMPTTGNPMEFVRFWIAHNSEYVSMKIGAFEPAENEPQMWGFIIADIAKHAARGMVQVDETRGDARDLIAKIEAAFYERLKQDPEFAGVLKGAE